MPAGRPPKPTAVKKAAGNPGRRPLNKDPKPPEGAIAMPAWLAPSPYAVEAWQHFEPLVSAMNVMTTADVQALALLCEALAEYREARDVIRDLGATYTKTTDRGGESVAVRGEVSSGADARRRASAMMQQFGLTPSARAKVQAMPDAAADDPFAAHDGPSIAGGKRVS